LLEGTISGHIHKQPVETLDCGFAADPLPERVGKEGAFAASNNLLTLACDHFRHGAERHLAVIFVVTCTEVTITTLLIPIILI
jgi:hypothetical protein